MKRATLNHPKLHLLCQVSGMSKREALGVLTLLWDFAGQYAPNGAVGRYTDVVIAQACDWPEKHAEKLVENLVRSGWLEAAKDKSDRLVVHDWQDHCEQWVIKRLKRDGGEFAKPKRTKRISRMDGRNGRTKRQPLPSQAKPSQAMPAPSPAQPSPAAPLTEQGAIAAVLDCGVGSARAQKIASVPGLTSLGVHRLWRKVKADAVKGQVRNAAGLLISKIQDRDFDSLPDPIPPEELCQLCKDGIVVAVHGVEVNEPVRWNPECLSIDGHKIPAAELTTESVQCRAP